jgi:hypothetical protein
MADFGSIEKNKCPQCGAKIFWLPGDGTQRCANHHTTDDPDRFIQVGPCTAIDEDGKIVLVWSEEEYEAAKAIRQCGVQFEADNPEIIEG